MKCPECNGATGVIETRLTHSGVRRRHKCCTCGNRFTTLEITIKEYKSMTEQLKNNKEVEELIDKIVKQRKEDEGK
jgi:transcriptional regulator NrdR family protein